MNFEYLIFSKRQENMFLTVGGVVVDVVVNLSLYGAVPITDSSAICL